MHILVTGSEGYLGSVLVGELLQRGHEVVGLDTSFYAEAALFREATNRPRTLVRDLRTIGVDDFAGFDAVAHLAELSNDPAGQLNPTVTYQINHEGSVRLARLAREAGVSRFIYFSSCSVYGVNDEDFVNEDSPTNPQTTYAVCKTLVERDVGALATDRFSPTFLRNATAFGASPRMRFDIVLNNLAGLAWIERRIAMTSDGTPWRPLVHALDICRAVAEALRAPKEAIHNEIFNIGSTDQNYRVRDIAQIVAETFVDCEMSFGPPTPDNRSYRVSFDKIRKHLPSYRCEWDAQRGARQLHSLFERIDMPADLFHHRCFTRLKQLEHLLRTKQIDQNFFWTDDDRSRSGKVAGSHLQSTGL